MPTQKKAVRLSETALDTLAANGSDLDGAISRRLNAVLDRYAALLSEPIEKPNPRYITNLWFVELLAIIYTRSKLDLPPLRLGHGPEKETILSPLREDILETRSSDGYIGRELHNDHTQELFELIATISPAVLVQTLERAEYVVSQVRDKDLIITYLDALAVLIEVDDVSLYIDISNGSYVKESNEPLYLCLTYAGQDEVQHVADVLILQGGDRPPEDAEDGTGWIESIPLPWEAVYQNGCEVIEMAFMIATHLSGAIAEYNASDRGAHRKAIEGIFDQYKYKVGIAASKISQEHLLASHSKTITDVVAHLSLFAPHTTSPLPLGHIRAQLDLELFRLRLHLTGYAEVEDIIVKRLTDQGIAVEVR